MNDIPNSPAPGATPDAPAGGTPGAEAGGSGGGAPAASPAPGATPTPAPTTPAPAPASTPPAVPATPGAPASTPLADPSTPAADPSTPPDNAFPADWRQQLAGEDKSFLKTLERYTTPADFAKAHRELQAKISSGQLKSAAPAADAPPEELAAWRKEMGIPDVPEAYFDKLELPPGVALGEADKPFAEDFAKAAHASNMTPKQLSAALAWYYDNQDRATIAREQQDGQFKTETRDGLVREWAGDFNPNMKAALDMINMAPPEIKDRLFAGRTSDGKIIGDDPAVLKWMARVGREINPASTLLPPGTLDAPNAIDVRLGEIESMMRNDRRAYDKNAAVQKEYRDLVEAKQKLQARK